MSTGLKREQVAAAFPGDDITAVPAGDLPDGLTDPVARRVLTEIGFPRAWWAACSSRASRGPCRPSRSFAPANRPRPSWPATTWWR
ncbi:hypothetical protein C8D88_105384 [Lentzea atacamensis]|uniref:Uncharacterized protein n=1 Tax=Lentzea atacamensis TaxID=531938 RepID=A0A316I1G2_9PSEU|nr:hypothetical protein C8D88_105384 [Lentzea atacamensis]